MSSDVNFFQTSRRITRKLDCDSHSISVQIKLFFAFDNAVLSLTSNVLQILSEGKAKVRKLRG